MPRGQENLRPQLAEQCYAFSRHRLRHGEDEPVAADGRDKGEGDARVPTGRLDQRYAGSQDPATLRIVD